MSEAIKGLRATTATALSGMDRDRRQLSADDQIQRYKALHRGNPRAMLDFMERMKRSGSVPASVSARTLRRAYEARMEQLLAEAGEDAVSVTPAPRR